MNEPLHSPGTAVVLLALDAALAAPLQRALTKMRVEVCAAGDVVERCSRGHIDLLVLSASIDESAGARLLAAVEGSSVAPPQAIVIFDVVDDHRRAALAKAGAWEHVLARSAGSSASPDLGSPASPDLMPLLGLIDRLLESDARDARLNAQARQFRALVEASSDGVYILRDGHFSWVNRRFQEMVGFSAEELLDPTFSMYLSITAPESRELLSERARRVDADLPVQPRYEFVALRKDGSRFDAQVSIAYLDLEDGRAGALGIMQDITERKSFEQQLLQRNRELQLLNGLSASVNQAVALDETLRSGSRHILTILGAEAAGISLLSLDRRSLGLKVSEGLPDELTQALHDIPLDAATVLARAVRTGEVQVVDDLASDARIAQYPPAATAARRSAFAGAIVVPLTARRPRTSMGTGSDVVGVAFAFLAKGRAPTEGDRDVMIAVGNVLGGAIEKASLLEAKQSALKKLVALDEIALALASTLDADEVALTVALSTHRLFGAMRVLIARLDDEAQFFVPMHVLDDGEPQPALVPISAEDTIMGLCLVERRPVQRVRPKEGSVMSVDPLDGRLVRVLPYERELFRQGVGTAVAVPVLLDGEPLAAIWLGYTSTNPLLEGDLQVLSAIGTHVAIATKNATLFEGRERALEELRAAQQKLVDSEKLNAIGLIAHGVAHDFNNVLGSILGRAELLKQQLHDPASLKHVDIIEKAAQDGAETVRRIQEIGRQERLDDFVAVDAAGIIEDVLELTRARWLERQVEVTTTTLPTGSGPIVVAGNPSELREVLINLVHNAIDAMPEDADRDVGATIKMHVSREGERVHIRVTDNGTGIPPDVVNKIFDPYFTTKGKRGTGLGLSVSHSIVRRHGGELKVTSSTASASSSSSGHPAHPRGTTFTLELPVYVQAVDDDNASVAPAQEKGVGRAKVLVVDDEENIREILAEMLMTADHEVITAQDGAEALHKLVENPDIDLVFTDLGLPGMSGYEVAQEMKRLRPDLLVGLVTGWGATLDPEKARAHGVDMVISKPFRFEQVLGLVQDALLLKKTGNAS
ncbi:MAG: response regulator [Deltaproteobacteria bacterium]|nr:response regulator [Deltaproteobacteria bacterium]